jgi:c(7)-type cytochrome triheme protein
MRRLVQRFLKRRSSAAPAALLAAAMLVVPAGAVRSEYGDIVLNSYAESAGMRPVVFPHWFHRVRFRCKVCHGDLGIKFQAGGNQINMLKIIDGQFCGACHDGGLAWSVENCDLCHSGAPGMATQVHGSTLQQLAPTGKPPANPGGAGRR